MDWKCELNIFAREQLKKKIFQSRRTEEKKQSLIAYRHEGGGGDLKTEPEIPNFSWKFTTWLNIKELADDQSFPEKNLKTLLAFQRYDKMPLEVVIQSSPKVWKITLDEDWICSKIDKFCREKLDWPNDAGSLENSAKQMEKLEEDLNFFSCERK